MEFDDFIEKIELFLTESKISARLEPLDLLFEAKTRIGLDIGMHGLKLVEIKQTPGGPQLMEWGIKEIPVGGSERETALVQALREFWQEKKIKTKRVQTVISDPKVYLRHITIPVVPEEDLVKAVRWQAEKHVPFAIDSAIVDFQILKSKMHEGERQMEILIVAVEAAVIEKYVVALKEAHLIPTTMDVAPFAAARALIRNYDFSDDEIVPLVDIGDHMTSIVIVKNDHLQLVRCIEFGLSYFSEALCREMNVTRQQAEALIKGFSMDKVPGDADGDMRVFVAWEAFLSELISQLNRSLAYCEQEFISEKIQRLYLSGGGALIRGLDRFLSKELKLNAEVVDPCRRLLLPFDETHRQQLGSEAPRLTAAVGEVL